MVDVSLLSADARIDPRSVPMSPRHLAVLALALAGVAWAADAPAAPTLGAAWFARLRDPQTRMAALYQHERAAAGEDEEIADPEAFAARHHGTLVFPCPQPRHPGAWAVVSPQVWREGRDLLVGADPQSYPPHPLESERRRAWDAALAKLPPDFKPWQAGQPWFESLSGFLVDASGKELETFYAGPAIIADFDADGMLDLMKIERLHVQRAAKAPDAYIDCISIGPLASTRPRKAMLYCNLRDESSWAARAWRFTVRANPPAALQLVLVPTANDRQEITYQFRKGRFVASLAKLPQDILENTRPGTDECEASAKFLKKHGLAFVGVGGDHPAELDANLPNPVPAGPLTWSLPDTSALAPRAAASPCSSAPAT